MARVTAVHIARRAVRSPPPAKTPTRTMLRIGTMRNSTAYHNFGLSRGATAGPTAIMTDSQAWLHAIGRFAGARRAQRAARIAATNPAVVIGKPIGSVMWPPTSDPTHVSRYARRAIAEDAGSDGSPRPPSVAVDMRNGESAGIVITARGVTVILLQSD
jgi:hypothetical protein